MDDLVALIIAFLIVSLIFYLINHKYWWVILFSGAIIFIIVIFFTRDQYYPIDYQADTVDEIRKIREQVNTYVNLTQLTNLNSHNPIGLK